MWTEDDAGDLINLDHIHGVILNPIDRTGSEAPEGHTYELLAINGSEESYRLMSGSEEACRKARRSLAAALPMVYYG